MLALAPLGLRRGRPSLLLAMWLAAGVVGFLGGGLYHPHYWIQLVPVLSRAGRASGWSACLHLPVVIGRVRADAGAR